MAWAPPINAKREIAMWKKFKALPAFVKIVIACLVVLFIYGAAHRKPDYDNHNFGPGYGPEPVNDDAKKQTLERLKARDAQLMAQYQQCQAQINQYMQQQMQSAQMGGGMIAPPACQQSQQQVLTQALESEVQFYRVSTGDYHSTVREIIARETGQSGGQGSGEGSGGYYAPAGGRAASYYSPSGGQSPSYYNPSTGSNDGGIAAVEQWDRNVIRENENYTDQDGETHELPSAPNYYQNNNTGEYVATPTEAPPDNQNSYTPLTSDDQ
jgi:hypothetical protein